MGVKNNFSQAVSELIGISRAADPEPEVETNELKDMKTEEVQAEDADSPIKEPNETQEESSGASTVMKVAAPASRNAVNPGKERIMAMLAQQQAQAQTEAAQGEEKQEEVQTEEKQEESQEEVQVQETQIKETPAQEAKPQTTFQRSFSQEPKEAPGLTTIAKGTVIIGEINAEGDVELLGSVKGKVASQGDIKANGKVIGDLNGRDIALIACAVQGNINASGLVNVDGDSVVVGDVRAENFCLDGKIKGNVTVEKEAKFQAKAILAGNVTTASIAMSQGAKIQGEVNIPLSEKETDMSFDLDIKI